MDVKFINLSRWYMQHWFRRLTWPWIVAASVTAFAAGFYFSMVEPAHGELEKMRQNLTVLQQEIRNASDTDVKALKITKPDQLAGFYRLFPSERNIPDLMETILAAASKNNLSLPEGKYLVEHDKTGKLLRYQVALPVKGTYPNLRGFINDVLSDVPTASLDHVKITRQKIGEETVESTILFTLYLGSES